MPPPWPPRRRPRALALAALAALLAWTCVGRTRVLIGYGSPLPMSVGDTVPATATVVEEVGTCSAYRYGSGERPGRFVWASSAPQVVAVDGRGVLRALRPGAARVTAAAAGRTSAPLVVHVTARAAP